MSQSFRYYIRVRYSECDGQKIVFNSRYGEYVDLGTSEYIRVLDFEDSIIQGELDYRLVKQTTEWFAPASFDQILELSISTCQVGNTSFRILTEFRIAEAPEIIAKAETIYVLVDGITFEKKVISESLKNGLQAGAENQVIDHAGYFPRSNPSS